MRWSEDGYLSQIMLAHALRQVSVSLILGVRQKKIMPRKKQIPFRNRSPFGWWIYRELEQWTPDPKSKRKQCLVWENTRIIKARDREEAYAKATKLGKEANPRTTEGGRWKFLGIADLLPIYEELEDGAEVSWNDLGYMSQSKAKWLVSAKNELSVFNDKED